MPNPTSTLTFGKTLAKRYGSMGASMATHQKLLAAKGALIKSAIPHSLKLKMVNGYRSAEKSLFGKTTTVGGENELGVSGEGTTMGMRMQIKRAGMAESNASPDPSSGS